MNRIRLENFTRISEIRRFRFLEAMEDLVRIRDENGEIMYENSSMREVVKNNLINHTKYIKSSDLFFDLYSSEKTVKETIKSEINLDGRIYAAKASPIFDENNKVEGYIEVYRDITGEKMLNNKLLEARMKIQNDILLAKNIQKSILPKNKKFRNIYFQFAHIPSDDLSGDVFDVVVIDENKIGVYIADVVGHGVSASIMTMFIRQSMRRILQENKGFGPEETILTLKKMYSQLELDISQYFSIIYMLIDTKAKTISYVNAGHNTFPILFNGGQIAILENKGKLISNLFKDPKYEVKTLKLIEGDKILMYTDGLTETKNHEGKFFDEQRLLNWLKRNKHDSQLVDKLVDELNMFRQGSQKDDIAILLCDIRSKNENKINRLN
ncbi:SpoIIE family protein phosphatase [uncultured Helcococcus sp.]|uniref:SpoIIE family protein phosphatase n=1 Tax=uncultured Helcococcus sp. TaxID=1072508 RepID=UPI002629EF75|nr:SpoIIE family protein phosphatase [uncultured Helcococcus sp.]